MVRNYLKNNKILNAPCLIHEEDNIIKRCLRDYFDSTYDEIIINEKNTLKRSKLSNNLLKKLKLV